MRKRLQRAALSRSGLGMLVLVVLACLCLLWAETEQMGPAPALGWVPLARAGWQGRDLPRLDPVALQSLRPDSYVWREYHKGNEAVQLAILYGQRKSTFHSPGFCLLSEGWNVAEKSVLPVTVGSRKVLFNKLVLQRGGQQVIALYTFLHGNRNTPSWLVHQARLVMARIERRNEEGALVRLIVPVTGSEAGATAVGEEFLSAFFPYITAGGM